LADHCVQRLHEWRWRHPRTSRLDYLCLGEGLIPAAHPIDDGSADGQVQMDQVAPAQRFRLDSLDHHVVGNLGWDALQTVGDRPQRLTHQNLIGVGMLFAPGVPAQMPATVVEWRERYPEQLRPGPVAALPDALRGG